MQQPLLDRAKYFKNLERTCPASSTRGRPRGAQGLKGGGAGVKHPRGATSVPMHEAVTRSQANPAEHVFAPVRCSCMRRLWGRGPRGPVPGQKHGPRRPRARSVERRRPDAPSGTTALHLGRRRMTIPIMNTIRAYIAMAMAARTATLDPPVSR